MRNDWSQIKARLEDLVEDDPLHWVDIRAALQRDELRDAKLATLEKVLQYVHHVLTDGGPIEADLCNSVQLAADGLRQRVEELEAELYDARHSLAHCVPGRKAAEAKLARVVEILESARASADGWNRTGAAALAAAKGE